MTIRQKDHLVREEINFCSCESAPLRITCSVSNRHGCVEGSNDSYRSSVLAHLDEVSSKFMTPSFFLVQYISAAWCFVSSIIVFVIQKFDSAALSSLVVEV
jgi:hypothetical protein